MEIRTDKFRRIMELLKPVVPKNPTVKVLTNILVKDGRLLATDLETAVFIDIPNTSGDAFLLPYRKTMEVLKYVQGDLMLTIEGKPKTVKLSWNGGSASYITADVTDYPDISINAPTSEAVLNGDMLIGSMAAALKYAATDSERPVLTGVGLKLGTVIQVAGADGFRATFESLRLSYPVETAVVVPPNAIKVLEHLWHKEPGQPGLAISLVEQLTAARPLTLGLDTAHMTVKFGKITVWIKMIAGAHPDVLALINGFQEPIKVQFMGPELSNAVRRLKDIAKEGSDIVRLWWNDTSMAVSARSAESGEVQAEIPVYPGAQPGRIALKLQYIMEVLADKDGLVTMGIRDQESPAVFHYGNRPLVVVMPMKAIWGDEPQEEPKLKEEKPAAAETTQTPAADNADEDSETDAETEADEQDDTSVLQTPNDMKLKPIEEKATEPETGEMSDIEKEALAMVEAEKTYTGPPVATVERLNIGDSPEPEKKKRGGKKKTTE